MKFDLKTLLAEAEEDSRYWQSQPDVHLSQEEIDQRMQQAARTREQESED